MNLFSSRDTSSRRRPVASLARRTCLLLSITLWAAVPAQASRTQRSLFQDDGYLIYASTPTVQRTLDRLRALGVQEIRTNLRWASVAPSPNARRAPAGFDATRPERYPGGVWSPWDRLVRLAAERGMTVQMNVTAPGPLWAVRAHAPTAHAADHWYPSPTAFYRFTLAVGRRYDGTTPGVPRVTNWSLWNEPNQPGWLAPQWIRHGRSWVPESAALYRDELRAGYAALAASGHRPGTDTVLIGELAPEGYESHGPLVAMPPMPFLRALYCLDGRYRRLRGSPARALGCPTGSAAAFARANPGLFSATGFAHHPYYFFHPPWAGAADPNLVPLANLSRLERGLDRALGAYGIHRRLPIFLTEYGYQTNPPDPYQLVSLAQQATYLNAADYNAWRDPRVAEVSQFLLYDTAPDLRYRPNEFRYWSTFQTGLLFADGRPKPALAAYAMPIWVPAPRVRRGGSLLVWGQLRRATHINSRRVLIQWRQRRGAYATIATVTSGSQGLYTARVRPPGSGWLRSLWNGAGGALSSREVPVTVR